MFSRLNIIVVAGVIAEGEPAPKMSSVRVMVSELLRNQPSPGLLSAFRRARGEGATKNDGTFSVANVFGRAHFQVTERR